MHSILECHRRLSALLGPRAEPVDVLVRAEEHRRYWRPQQVKVILLAESHVYTTMEEMARTIVLPSVAPPNLPRGFVRLVYCLGYGENRLLNRPIEAPPNTGTPQFWKIFYSCVNAVTANGDFAPIQASSTPPAERIANKIALLKRLRELGVWLLDTCLAALYPKPSRRTVVACLQESWDHHVHRIVESASPSHVICIGKGVARALGQRLPAVGARASVVPQPNARLASADHYESFRTYYKVVQEANGFA